MELFAGYITEVEIRDEVISLDIFEELEGLEHRFDKATVRGNKFIACSPFRADSSPSFAINLDNGLWVDSGATDENYRKGNFISLLAKLEEKDYNDVATYLLRKYSITTRDTEGLSLNMRLKPVDQNKQELTLEHNVSQYLLSRGISAETQELYGTAEHDNYIAIPWKNPKGGLINIKYRQTGAKQFWYNNTGVSIRPFLFGMDLAKSKRIVWVVESEIDAMYLHTAGYWAVAIGRASISDKQIEALLNSTIEEIIIAVDNDKVGRAFKEVLIELLVPHFIVSTINFPSHVKDINDCAVDEIKTMYIERTATRRLGVCLLD